MTTPAPIVGKIQPHQRPDGTFTQHDYESWGEDMRHQFSGYTVLAEIFVCRRCGREKNKPLACVMGG
jgi:hypothetical protein